ncbi:MAG: LysR substrate-binding domain-containing protein [Pseudomonadota bacterium]
MRIRHIEVFHAVYSSGSVTQAARMLNVSQPSVSKVLGHAELQLGFELFERVSGRLVPTPEAERLYDHVERLFDEIGVVRRVANNLRNLGDGKLRIAATPAMGMDLVPKMAAEYMKAFPGVFFEMETLHYSEIAAALNESRIDIALAFDPPANPSLTEIPMGSGQFVFIEPPELQSQLKAPIDLAELAELPFVRLNNRGPLGQILDNYLQESAASLQVVAATETYHIAKSLVAHGVGVSIVDEITARSGEHLPVRILPLKLPLQFQVSLLHLRQAPISQPVRHFIEYSRTTIAKLLNNPPPANADPAA